MIITEGNTKISLTNDHETVFYNERGSFNRSLGVIFIAAENELKERKLDVADVFAASGVRGIRYANETESIKTLYLNDISPNSEEILKKNIKMNQIDSFSEVYIKDANYFLVLKATEGEKLDVVDIDPFGPPTPFIDCGLQAVKKNGVIAITATDLAPLCGIPKKAALRKYGSLSIREEFCHETASRILIKIVLEACGRRGLTGKPLLTVFTEHYIRFYARIKKSKDEYPYSKIGFIFSCSKGHWITTSSMSEKFENICRLCDTKCVVAGPLWLGKLHDEATLDRIFSKIDILKNETHKRKITKLIPRFKEEDMVSIPYFFDIARTADRLDVTTPSIDFVMKNLIRLGFTAYRTHFSHTGVKTNAPRDIFSEIVSQKT